MNINPFLPLLCPVEGNELILSSKNATCSHGHSYDFAKEGYLNLLLVQHKGSLQPGDTKEMVEARFQFLNSHHFSPIAQKLVLFVQNEMNPKREYRILDAGCGDGYYLDQLALRFQEIPHVFPLFLGGLDISKWAIQKAARRNVQKNFHITWIVASNKNIPVPKKSVDLLLCFFGFPVWSSFHEVLSTDGKVLLVDPGPLHLIELRKIIYPEIHIKAQRPLNQTFENKFKFIHEEKQVFQIKLNSSQEILQLLKMTPHSYKISLERIQQLEKLQTLTVTVDVDWRVFQSIAI